MTAQGSAAISCRAGRARVEAWLCLTQQGANAQPSGCSCLPSESSAGSCVWLCVCPEAVLGLGASISCSGESLAWEPGTPLLVASWHGDMQGTKRTFGKEHIQLK